MTHDIDDLLAIIKGLEERIIEIELICRNNEAMNMIRGVHDDAYYWNH